MTQTTANPGLIEFDRPGHRPQLQERDRAKPTHLFRSFCLSYWTEAGLEKESLLQAVMDFLQKSKYFIILDRGWSDWDLEIHQGIWSKATVKVCTENHGGNKRVHLVRCTLLMSQFAIMAMLGYSLLIFLAIILGMPKVAAVTVVVSAINGGVILYQNFKLGRILYQVLEIVAKKLYLLPIQAKTSKKLMANG